MPILFAINYLYVLLPFLLHFATGIPKVHLKKDTHLNFLLLGFCVCCSLSLSCLDLRPNLILSFNTLCTCHCLHKGFPDYKDSINYSFKFLQINFLLHLFKDSFYFTMFLVSWSTHVSMRAETIPSRSLYFHCT